MVFGVPTLGQLIVTVFAVWLAYWMYKTDKEESKKQKQLNQEAKEQIDNTLYLTTTRVKFQRHLSTILDKVASSKLQSVIIADEKEIPQSVLLPYCEYQILQSYYKKSSPLEKEI